MEEHIQIGLFRVSFDSKFLDLMTECPKGMFFTYAQVEVRCYRDGKWGSEFFIFDGNILGEEKQQIIARIPLSNLFKESIVPAMYILTLHAAEENHIGEEDEKDYTIEDVAICSDVNDVFYYILDNIKDLDEDCEGISDDSIRNYLILYGHYAAMSQKDFDTAEEYFKILVNKFVKCGQGKRDCANSCGCKSSISNVKPSCGCKV